MFRKREKQLHLEGFVLPFEGKLRADNRWVKLAKIIPWDTIEDRYAKLFTSNRKGLRYRVPKLLSYSHGQSKNRHLWRFMVYGL